jgi:hypothetical protein
MVKVDECVGRPQAPAEIVSRDDLGGAFQQHRQNLERLFLQLDSYARFAEFMLLEVKLEQGKTEDPRGRDRWPLHNHLIGCGSLSPSPNGILLREFCRYHS